MNHRPVLPPRKADWKKGNYQIGLFMRTADGGVVQLSINDANAAVCSLASQIIAEAALGKEKPVRTAEEWHAIWRERFEKREAARLAASAPEAPTPT